VQRQDTAHHALTEAVAVARRNRLVTAARVRSTSARILSFTVSAYSGRSCSTIHRVAAASLSASQGCG